MCERETNGRLPSTSGMALLGILSCHSACAMPLVTFQHFINDILWDMLDQFIIIYLDDIFFSLFLEDEVCHDQHIWSILETLYLNHLSAKLEKCQVGQDTVEFLAYFISPKDLGMDSQNGSHHRLGSTKIPPQNTMLHGLCQFLQVIYQRVVWFVHPITLTLWKGTWFVWSSEAQTVWSPRAEIHHYPHLDSPRPRQTIYSGGRCFKLCTGSNPLPVSWLQWSA